MSINKPRGSQEGLKKNRELLKVKNTEAMWSVVVRLRKESPNSLWSYKEVWSGAGLKSNVALNSPWNLHIREAIDSHNSKLRENAELGPLAQTQRKTLRMANRELRMQLDAMKKERDQALSKIAVFEAEADFYKRKCESLLRINERLRANGETLSVV
ncbi:hypothetical protein APB20_35005 [Pseudomonas aeruginosa]|uniref:hypothetical protein n=1 Tax=Pseudomonas aeruginosa TaxID=287 RepID=UPI0008FAF941|nr:hypothetical protein [Pseudomonas aeruginosa]OPE29840.1 hypothetical protein APB20_35005 [Pseudomonas aeruginosa]